MESTNQLKMKCNGAFQKLPLWALTIFSARTQRVINLFNLLKAVITETYFAKHISPRKRIEKYDFKHHYLVLLKSLRDRSQVDHLAKQMFPGHSKYIQESFQDAN